MSILDQYLIWRYAFKILFRINFGELNLLCCVTLEGKWYSCEIKISNSSIDSTILRQLQISIVLLFGILPETSICHLVIFKQTFLFSTRTNQFHLLIFFPKFDWTFWMWLLLNFFSRMFKINASKFPSEQDGC